jgi:hypothetical protein
VAHFARIVDALVQQVVVISNFDVVDAEGIEQEALGVALCEQIVGPGRWLQTSYNGKFRRHYAGLAPSMTYSDEHDAFLYPSPFPSWVLDLDNLVDWSPPIPMPTDEGYWYEWDEQGQQWIPHEIEQPTP